MLLTTPGHLPHPATRIVSLVPSQTELLQYLGLQEETVGITKFCIHPDEWYRNKIRVGGTKTVDIQKINQLQPDLVIANLEENVREQVEAIARDFPVWVTDVNNLDDALQMIVTIGQLTGKTTAAGDLAAAIAKNFSKPGTTSAIPVCYLIWKDPYMAAASGTFIDDMLERAGFRNVFAGRQRYPEISLAEIREAKPKIIFLSSEPYPFKDIHLAEFQELLPGTIPVLVDGEMFSWYGSRLLLAPAYFSELRLHLREISNRH